MELNHPTNCHARRHTQDDRHRKWSLKPKKPPENEGHFGRREENRIDCPQSNRIDWQQQRGSLRLFGYWVAGSGLESHHSNPIDTRNRLARRRNADRRVPSVDGKCLANQSKWQLHLARHSRPLANWKRKKTKTTFSTNDRSTQTDPLQVINWSVTPQPSRQWCRRRQWRRYRIMWCLRDDLFDSIREALFSVIVVVDQVENTHKDI